LADILPLQGVPVVLYGSEHGSYEENRLRTNSETETAPRAESVFVETLKIEDFFPVVGLMEKLGGYMGFNSGEYLSPSQDSSIQAQQNLLRRLSLEHLLVKVPPRVEPGDVLLTLWENGNYYRTLFDIVWQKGGKVVQGYTMGSFNNSSLPFRYSLFCSRAMLDSAEKNYQSRNPRGELTQDEKNLRRILPPFFPERGGEGKILSDESGTENNFSAPQASCESAPEPACGSGPQPSCESAPEPAPAFYLGRIQEEKGAWEFYRIAYYNRGRQFWMAGQGEAWIDGRIATEVDFPLRGRGSLAISRCNKPPLWISLADVPNLTYYGFVGPETRRSLLSRAGALIQLSQYDEPYGWNVAEAHLCGLPTITTKRGAFLETVEEGLDGFYLPPDTNCDDVPQVVESLLLKASQLPRREIRDKAERTYKTENLLKKLKKYLEKISERPSTEDYLIFR